jgi:hypothetical protein
VKDLRSGEQVEVDREKVADWLLANGATMPRRGSMRP